MTLQNILVSSATARNWNRLGIHSKNDIAVRLSKRANKRFSQKNIIPFEYINNQNNLQLIENLIEYIRNNNVNIKDAIYNIAINLLKKENMLSKNNLAENKYLQNILENQKTELDENIINFKIPIDEKDILGILYQNLLKEGDKNKIGSYYTPPHIVEIIENLKLSSDYKILDPCCGTGSFLMYFANKVENPNNIYGIDKDPIACFIAKINLILKYKDIEFNPNIFCTDFLSLNAVFHNIHSEIKNDFDIITTNPPWGSLLSSDYKCLFTNVQSNEAYSYFITKSKEFLNKNGICFFVLPISILNVAVHKDIREFILNNFNIKEIQFLGKAFNGVLTDVVSLLLTPKTNCSKVKIIKNNIEEIVEQNIFCKNINFNFTDANHIEYDLLKKIFSKPHNTLVNSIWGLGIVTGNNKKYISSNPVGKEKIYTGKEISTYFLKNSNKYIDYKRENFQQVANESIYRAKEKLVYKFISNKLVFAYDNGQNLMLNSANILIPQVENYSIKSALAFLNSKLFQYIYRKKFNEIKILKGNLLQLPFPVLTNSQEKEIMKIVDKILVSKNISLMKDIENIIFNIFNLNSKEILLIER
ncbi:MAG: N-6 DNA methylase [Fibromonadales bacterium]|nr:N-6 DNA methylase [Fibromonadales bacterium]